MPEHPIKRQSLTQTRPVRAPVRQGQRIMADQVGPSRTSSDETGAGWGQFGQAAASCAPPAPTGNGVTPCWEPNRSQTGARSEPDRLRSEQDWRQAGARPEPDWGKVGARPGQVRHCPDPATDWDGTGNPRLPPASDCHIRRLNRAIGPKSLTGHMPGRAPDSYGRGRRDKPALTDGCFGPPDGLIGPFATGVRVVWRGTMAAKFDCSVRSGSQTGQPDRKAGLENGPENGS